LIGALIAREKINPMKIFFIVIFLFLIFSATFPEQKKLLFKKSNFRPCSTHQTFDFSIDKKFISHNVSQYLTPTLVDVASALADIVC
jgi:hypothetical protein